MFKNQAKELLPIIEAFANNKEVEFRAIIGGEIFDWVSIGRNPSWEYDPSQYRIRPDEDPFKELKDAFKDGKTIQVHYGFSRWVDDNNPNFGDNNQYRIKPEEEDPFKELKEAFKDGKTIEFLCDKHWVEIERKYGASWQYGIANYRIKPEPKLVPFTFEDNKLFRDRWIKKKGKQSLKRIMTTFYNSVIIFDLDQYSEMETLQITYEKLLLNYEFEDKTPCGKYINE